MPSKNDSTKKKSKSKNLYVPVLARFKREGKYGFINEMGEETIPPTYDDAGEFTRCSTGYYTKVRLNGKQGFINTAGEPLVPIIYDDLSGFTPIYSKEFQEHEEDESF